MRNRHNLRKLWSQEQEVLQITISNQVVRQVVVRAVFQPIQIVQTEDEISVKLVRVYAGQVCVLPKKYICQIHHNDALMTHFMIHVSVNQVSLKKKYVYIRTLTYGIIIFRIVS